MIDIIKCTGEEDCECDRCYFGEEFFKNESAYTRYSARKEGRTFNEMIRKYNKGELCLIDEVEPSNLYKKPGTVERGLGCRGTLAIQERLVEREDPNDQFPGVIHLSLDSEGFGFANETASWDRETWELLDQASVDEFLTE